VWRVKLVAELRPGVMTETEVARIERDEQAGLADLGLRLAETKRLTAALQAEIVPAQVAAVGEQRRCCSSCGRRLASKGHYPVTFRSLFGDVPVRVRRLLVCPCQEAVEVKSFGVLDLGHDAIAPELAYVTARYAALAPFGKVATPATVLCDGDAGLWRLQREALPAATVALDWWHVAIRFEHALRTARGLGAGAADADLADEAVRNLERAKWRLWHGRWTGCRRKLAGLYRRTKRKHLREIAGIDRLQRHISELLGYLERNEDMLVHYAARRRRGEPISTAFVESAVNEIVAKRMNKKQQMRWNRTTVQPFLDVRTAVLNETLEDAFRRRYPGFRSANDDQARSVAA
jgi:hypothetical protein